VAYRIFEDALGAVWEVWDVLPGSAERRAGERRSSEARAAAGDRRVERLSAIGVHQDLSAGWLCFLSGSDKRRLAPIPSAWEQLDMDALRELHAAARPAAVHVELAG